MNPYLLPPGPWGSKGNKLVTGNGQTIATVFYPRNAAQIAEALAKYPELAEEIAALRDEIEKLREQLEDMSDE